jgi:3-phosphoshikimate 1-carboxyvinyltransferase
VPGSKSITNRALPLAALCEGETELRGVLFADDTRRMIEALVAVGYELQVDDAARIVKVKGRGRELPAGKGGTIVCGNSGTTIRFLTGMLALGKGEFVLDGIARMRERPIDELVDQLRALGAEIRYEAKDGFPPVRIMGKGLRGGICAFSDAKSSQYISAVLMAAPYATREVIVRLLGAVTSEPYVAMTLRMMEQFGVVVTVDAGVNEGSRSIEVAGGTYRVPASGIYEIEPDASNASYFLAAGAVVPGSEIIVEGLGKNSLQGDAEFAEVLGLMGAGVEYGKNFIRASAPAEGKILRGIEIDMNRIPDMVQTVAVVALFAQGKTVVRNVWNLRVKETDRLAALEMELRKLGATVETGRDWISIVPPTSGKITPASIATYDDHRMAMAFAIAGLRDGGVRILDPGCTAKTYPDYFADLSRAVGT